MGLLEVCDIDEKLMKRAEWKQESVRVLVYILALLHLEGTFIVTTASRFPAHIVWTAGNALSPSSQKDVG